MYICISLLKLKAAPASTDAVCWIVTNSLKLKIERPILLRRFCVCREFTLFKESLHTEAEYWSYTQYHINIIGNFSCYFWKIMPVSNKDYHLEDYRPVLVLIVKADRGIHSFLATQKKGVSNPYSCLYWKRLLSWPGGTCRPIYKVIPDFILTSLVKSTGSRTRNRKSQWDKG